MIKAPREFVQVVEKALEQCPYEHNEVFRDECIADYIYNHYILRREIEKEKGDQT